MKVCNKCDKEKDFTEFHKSPRNKDGFKTTCKQCRSIENKTVLKDRLKDKNLRANYDITLNEYNVILKNQKHKCKICGVQEKHCNRGLFVDHNHETGSVRALLCHHCNSGLGHFRDRQEFLLKAVDYLNEYEGI
jgi:hypothetical protein